LHRDAWRQEDHVDERRAPAGVRPVDHDDATVGHQQVVGPEVGVQQRRPGRVSGPGRLHGGQVSQAGARPGVEAVIAGSLDREAPAAEVVAEVLPDAGRGDRRGRQHVRQLVDRAEAAEHA
jgi:hypothetical protein